MAPRSENDQTVASYKETFAMWVGQLPHLVFWSCNILQPANLIGLQCYRCTLKFSPCYGQCADCLANRHCVCWSLHFLVCDRFRRCLSVSKRVRPWPLGSRSPRLPSERPSSAHAQHASAMTIERADKNEGQNWTLFLCASKKQ